MLFNNFEPYEIPETGDVSREQLKKDFPDFYEGKSVTLVPLASRYSNVLKVFQESKKKLASYKKAPSPIGHKAVFHVTIDKKPIALQYSETMPEAGSWGKRFPGGLSKINIGERFIIQPHQEDLLFAMHFGADYIENNKCQKRTGEMLYEWHVPATKAVREITDWRQRNAVEKQVFNDLSEADVKRVVKGLGIGEKTTLAQTQVHLRNEILRQKDNAEFQTLYNDLIKSKPQESSGVDVSEIVSELLAEGKIKEVEGGFVSKSKVNIGEWNKTPFFKTTKKGDEAFLALVEHLKVNSEQLEKIK